MEIGTAKLRDAETSQGYRYVLVYYKNVGSDLACEPRAFVHRNEALAWCLQGGLRVVS